VSKKSDKSRLEFILEMIEDIDYIVAQSSITKALESRISKPAILMCLMQIGETLNKVESIELKVQLPIKGAYDVRNFIAHDYEGVDLALIEHIVRELMPSLRKVIKENL
jgi:uncharacterized protein with HEPN domain